ncbi:hypothetical protein [Winogradskyella sp.]|jgi:hypothetical protein|uniref:hypothetical protein n=1 Tax=Winogradskyella sp. TaxID=1883156 RepID=UPI0025ECD392|nr:hypothetical protein [Winogradskyella sp.]MCT4628886.1 hypothetical protein [Winogradskyella sp.]
MNVSDIKNRILNAKDLDFGNVFNNSIELFKKTWVQGLVTVLLNMVLAIPVVMVVYIPMFFLGLFDVFSSGFDSYGYYDSYNEPEVSLSFLLLVIPMYLFLLVVMSTISFGLRAAFYRICKMKDFNEMGREDYFYFLKKGYLGKTVKLSLVSVGIAVVASLLCVLPIFYVMIPLYYMYIVYAFNPEKSVSEIVNLSFAIGNKKWLLSFGLLLITGFLATIVGFFMCVVGVYITQSFIMLPTYLIYKDVVGFEDGDGELQIQDIKF